MPIHLVHIFVIVILDGSPTTMASSIPSAKMLTNVMLIPALSMLVIPIRLVPTLMAPMIASVISDGNQTMMVIQIPSVLMSMNAMQLQV